MPDQPARRLCADQPDGIPHYVDRPRARRCDQHRQQRHRWSDANLYRAKQNPPLPPLPWKPDPLTYERRREALREFADRNATDIVEIVARMRDTLHRLRLVRRALDSQSLQHFDVGAARLEALTSDLLGVAAAMGWTPTNPTPAKSDE